MPVRQSRVQSMFTQVTERARGKLIPETYLILWLRSLKTRETPGLSITFGTLSACRSIETKDYWTSHCFYRISFCSRVYWNAFILLYGGPQLSREKQITHGKSISITAKANSVTAKVNSLTAKANRSRQKQINSECDILIVKVSQVLLLFTVGHRFHSPCFPSTLASRVTANIIYF